MFDDYTFKQMTDVSCSEYKKQLYRPAYPYHGRVSGKKERFCLYTASLSTKMSLKLCIIIWFYLIWFALIFFFKKRHCLTYCWCFKVPRSCSCGLPRGFLALGSCRLLLERCTWGWRLQSDVYRACSA